MSSRGKAWPAQEGPLFTPSSPAWERATTIWAWWSPQCHPTDGHPRLFRGLPYGPDAVDLVECHATSTRQGDVEEARALKAFFNSSRRTVITSFKSQIGHTLGASGINSLIRGVTAMKAGVFPPPSIICIRTRKSTWKDRGSSSPRSHLIGSAGTASQEGFRSTPSGLEVPTTLCRSSRPWMRRIRSWSQRAENPVSIAIRGRAFHAAGHLFLPD